MSWTRTIATGWGQLAWRLSIDGWPCEWVTSADMQTTVSGRIRYAGLKSDGIKFRESCDLPQAKLEATGFTAKVADLGQNVTLSLNRRPTKVCYVPAGVTIDDATDSIEVTDTTGFDGSGYIHINTEAIQYESIDGTHFLGCTRGVWNSHAQYHYSSDGARLAFPEVTNVPQVMEGRRARIYAYGAGDSPTGEGTLVWRGVVRSEPRFDGVQWAIPIDSLATILETDLGSDLEDPAPLRGIFYPASAPLFLQIMESSSNTIDPVDGASAFAVAGFWESQTEFIDFLNDTIEDRLADPIDGAFTQIPRAVSVDGGRSWAIEYTADSVSPRYMSIYALSATDQIGAPWSSTQSLGDSTSAQTVTAGETRRLTQASYELGTVPRATVGSTSVYDDYVRGLRAVDIINPFTQKYKVYLGGVASVTSGTTALSIEWDSFTHPTLGESNSDSAQVAVTAVSASERSVTFGRPSTIANPPYGGGSFYAAVASTSVEIKQGRSYGAGSFADFWTTLTGQTAEYINTGATPDIWSDDIDTGDIAELASTSPMTANRFYTVFSEVDLKELVQNECKLLGVYPALTSDGKITFRKLKAPSAAEAISTTINASKIIVDDSLMGYERSALGMYNTVVLRRGYDPIEDEYTVSPIKVRDVASYGIKPMAKVLEIAPKSIDPSLDVSLEDVVRLASRVLGVFGGPYATLKIDVPLTLWDVMVGDLVSLTWDKVPESDGTVGVSAKAAMVIAREWEPMAARGSFALLLTEQKVGGYVPSFKIDIVTPGSGTGPFTATPESGYLPSGTDPTDFWEVGDKIRLYKWNSTSTTGDTTGTVTQVTDISLVFTTDASWTNNTADWVVSAPVSTSISRDNQQVFVYLARSDLRLDWLDETNSPPFTFAP